MSNETVLLDALLNRSSLADEIGHHLDRLGPSYLLVGPPGSGKLQAMKAMAKAVLCPDRGCGTCGVCLGVEQEIHPDCSIIQRSGAYLSVEEARIAVSLASRSPAVASKRVIILPEAHLFERAAPALLKSIEEATSTTLFLLSAESLPESLAPLISRCVRIDVPPPTTEQIVNFLLGMGFERERAERSDALASGRLDRAWLLAKSDEALSALELWSTTLDRLVKDPVTLAILAGELENTLPRSPKTKRRPHKRTDPGLSNSDGVASRPLGRSEELAIVREERRQRADLLRAGLEQILQRIVFCGAHDGWPAGATRSATEAVLRASSALRRNANEAVLIRALIFELAGLELSPVVPE